MNLLNWDFQEGKIAVAGLEEIQKTLSIRFPDDYVQCAIENNGGTPDKEGFNVSGRGPAVFNYLLSFHKESSIYIIDIYESVRDRLCQGVIPIADDPFGNLICFDFRESASNPPIVFWDHEVESLNPDSALFPVCQSFTALLEMLYTV